MLRYSLDSDTFNSRAAPGAALVESMAQVGAPKVARGS